MSGGTKVRRQCIMCQTTRHERNQSFLVPVPAGKSFRSRFGSCLDRDHFSHLYKQHNHSAIAAVTYTRSSDVYKNSLQHLKEKKSDVALKDEYYYFKNATTTKPFTISFDSLEHFQNPPYPC
jgi:hypothetical protein